MNYGTVIKCSQCGTSLAVLTSDATIKLEGNSEESLEMRDRVLLIPSCGDCEDPRYEDEAYISKEEFADRQREIIASCVEITRQCLLQVYKRPPDDVPAGWPDGFKEVFSFFVGRKEEETLVLRSVLLEELVDLYHLPIDRVNQEIRRVNERMDRKQREEKGNSEDV